MGKIPASTFTGNSILLELKGKTRYVFIGHNVYEFTALEPITKFVSPVGGSDVPYPIAYSQNYVYFFIDDGMKSGDMIAKSFFPTGTRLGNNAFEVYELIHEHRLRSKLKKLPRTKVIIPRVY